MCQACSIMACFSESRKNSVLLCHFQVSCRLDVVGRRESVTAMPCHDIAYRQAQAYRIRVSGSWAAHAEVNNTPNTEPAAAAIPASLTLLASLLLYFSYSRHGNGSILDDTRLQP